ncbi:MAG: AMP-binding protein [Candidatus Micrarchaeota archaeon]
MMHIASLLAQMRSDQWKSPEELRATQEKKLRELFEYAKNKVPYYRKKFEGRTVRSLDDLPALPILRKQDIRSNTLSLISSAYRESSLKKMSTSGSTGTPLDIYHSAGESAYGPAFEMRQLTEAGIGPFDKVVHIIYHNGKPRLLQNLGIFRRHYLSMHDDEKANLKKLKEMKPKALICHPSYALPMAHANQGDGALKIEKLFSYAELLTPKARAFLEASFGAKVYDMYGSMETSWLAWQCEKGSMHLHSDHVIAEIVDEQGRPVKDGEYGNIVVTPLWQRAMPLLRYSLGDRTAIGEKCACKRGLQTLKPIEGRDDDFIVLPSGRPISGRFVGVFIRDIPGAVLFQARQDNEGELKILIVTEDGKIDGKDRKKLSDDLNAFFPEKLDIKVELVESIPRGRSGKLQSVVSSLKPSIDLQSR